MCRLLHRKDRYCLREYQSDNGCIPDYLILATQRPDANILPGQIKNNMNIRICGRADTTLSTIIIGDGRAAEQIPHDAQGRFIMEDGTVFQAYYFSDDTISKW